MAASSGGPPVPTGGVAPLPAVVVPALPDVAALTQVIGAPGGIAAAFMHLYGHVRQMGQSVQSVLQVHFSFNDINHDQLDQQIEFNRSKLAEHEAKLDQASGIHLYWTVAN